MRRKLLGDARNFQRGSENDRGGGEGRQYGRADLSQLRGFLFPQQVLPLWAQILKFIILLKFTNVVQMFTHNLTSLTYNMIISKNLSNSFYY